MPKFQLFDAVRVVRVPAGQRASAESRLAKVGDIGVVMMVYDSPREGYGVEGVEDDGRNEWYFDFAPEDLERV